MPIVAVATAAVSGIFKLAKGKVGKAIGKGVKKVFGGLFGKKKKKKKKAAAKAAALAASNAANSIQPVNTAATTKGAGGRALLAAADGVVDSLQNDGVLPQDEEITQGISGQPKKDNKKMFLIGGGVLAALGLGAIILKNRNNRR